MSIAKFYQDPTTLFTNQNNGVLVNGVIQAARAVLRSPTWFSGLQKASFRGVPFGVLTSDANFGRKVAVHEYPGRDTPWVEDLGRKGRRIQISGFLVSNSLAYKGGDVIAQRARIAAAFETAGSATFVHPTLGRLMVTPEDGVTVVERWDRGRYFEISFSVIESGANLFPGVAVSTVTYVERAAALLDGASISDFTSKITDALPNGSAIIDQVRETAGSFGDQITGAIGDASNTFSMLGDLPGNFGLFPGGANLNVLGDLTGSLPGSISGAFSGSIAGLPEVLSPTVESLTSQAAAARQAVGDAVSGMNLRAFGI